MIKIILVLTLIILFFSCSNRPNKEKLREKQKLEVEENEKKEKENYEKKKNKIIATLVSKYHINYLWDTLHYEYTINYSPVIESKYQLIGGEVGLQKDVYEQDTILYLSTLISFYPTFYFTFSVSRDYLNKILDDSNDLIFVVSVSEIKKMPFGVKVDLKDEDLLSAPIFIGKGKIIEVASIKKLEID